MNLDMYFEVDFETWRKTSPVLKISKIYIMRDLEPLPAMTYPEASLRISENESGDYVSECYVSLFLHA
jgi:hypothetical protein